MIKAWKNFVTSLKPKYTVVVTMYHVIPGVVKRNATKHEFGKGQYEEAKTFFEKVIRKTSEIKLAPAEVHLVKGKKRVMHYKHFGPVDKVKQMKMSA